MYLDGKWYTETEVASYVKTLESKIINLKKQLSTFKNPTLNTTISPEDSET